MTDREQTEASSRSEGQARMDAIRKAVLSGDYELIEVIRSALLAANEDVYGDEGNIDALAALEEVKGRLYERE